MISARTQLSYIMLLCVTMVLAVTELVCFNCIVVSQLKAKPIEWYREVVGKSKLNSGISWLGLHDAKCNSSMVMSIAECRAVGDTQVDEWSKNISYLIARRNGTNHVLNVRLRVIRENSNSLADLRYETIRKTCFPIRTLAWIGRKVDCGHRKNMCGRGSPCILEHSFERKFHLSSCGVFNTGGRLNFACPNPWTLRNLQFFTSGVGLQLRGICANSLSIGLGVHLLQSIGELFTGCYERRLEVFLRNFQSALSNLSLSRNRDCIVFRRLIEGFPGNLRSSCGRVGSFSAGAQLESGDCSVDTSGNKCTPGSSLNGFLYAVMTLFTGGLVSFRLLVSGDDILKPEWANSVLLFLSFLCCIYGFYLLLGIGVQHTDGFGYAAQFWNQ